MWLSTLVLNANGIFHMPFELSNRFAAAFTDLASFLTAIGTVVTAALAWGAESLAVLELAVAESFILQLMVGASVITIGFAILAYIAKIVKTFLPKAAK